MIKFCIIAVISFILSLQLLLIAFKFLGVIAVTWAIAFLPTIVSALTAIIAYILIIFVVKDICD